MLDQNSLKALCYTGFISAYYIYLGDLYDSLSHLVVVTIFLFECFPKFFLVENFLNLSI